MTNPPNILVLCTGNSCRSQLLHGYLNKLLAGRAQVDLAGHQQQTDDHQQQDPDPDPDQDEVPGDEQRQGGDGHRAADHDGDQDREGGSHLGRGHSAHRRAVTGRAGARARR